MPTSSLEELKGRIAAGEYAVDSRTLAGTILSTFATIRRVAHIIMSGEEGAGPGRVPRHRGSQPAASRSLRPQRERPS